MTSADKPDPPEGTPERIYLCLGAPDLDGIGHFDELRDGIEGVLWCEDQIETNDPEYIRCDVVRRLLADERRKARAELIAEIAAPGPVAYKWRTAARFKTGTPAPWHLSLEGFCPIPREVDEIACYAIPKE